ncbi:MAG: SMI1/KNR4 family protein [Chlamydiales bacterium]|nr:SMI1/KNR4 family protein [Chlamydiia bacterium]MCP5507592.1 SMI1/KNR4 family protein [Chlamydiales bacterium]
MDHHFSDYFHEFSEGTPIGSYHRVVYLHEAPDMSWEIIHKQIPSLPRGWFELAQLTTKDRIDFVRQFWGSQMTYHPNLDQLLDNFFANLDEIGVVVTQKKYDDPYEPMLVYSLSEDRGYYRGMLPASDDDIVALQSYFALKVLPTDYTSFLQIHDGFQKTTDCTGITSSKLLPSRYEAFQKSIEPEEVIYTKNGVPVNPKMLIPFYESFGLPFYHCFWAEWYPENEMGNVYYESTTKTISDISDGGTSTENLAFPTFTDWLIFYLEQV